MSAGVGQGPRVAPPAFPGWTYLGHLASGGFGDVFRYRDHLGRQIAVKVLHQQDLSDSAERAFRTEASRMATLENPYVLQVYNYDLTVDGRPYLVMRFCPDSLEDELRRGRLDVEQALRYGVQVASAVEAAHEAGLFHRDIKPANVLLRADGTPALTDFGIAGGRDTADDGPTGLSHGYAAPEVIEGRRGEVRADVFSLGATVFATLAGRSPFHVAGGDNSIAAVATRTVQGTVPSTGHPDAPASLERVLAQALATDPALRFPSAVAFARALQEIEVQLGFGRTPAPFGSVITADRPGDRTDDADGTRAKAPQRVDPSGGTGQPVSGTAPPMAPATTTPPASEQAEGAAADTPAGGTVQRGGTAEPAPRTPVGAATEDAARGAPGPGTSTDRGPDRSTGDQESGAGLDGRGPTSPTGRRGALTAVAVALLFLIVGTVTVLGGQAGTEPSAAPETEAPISTPPPDGGSLFDQPTVPREVRFSRDGDTLEISWEPDPVAGATYVVTVTDGPLAGRTETVERPLIALTAEPDQRTCVRVLAVVGSTSSDPSREECTR